ncbi:family 16 glycosylhydrolase [Aquimarina sp. MMG016]|uniref:family 16 glycosylhydrolase n=1 Tax=Aquimarina sp. MMG016 TaxID=2822690 RepID=UPI001B3A143C|nr:family 16 glycosylhydrolase [Aquimarina sp. MMG016]MBQ4822349.1 family 16 glycosylhydrolase [Aquimarina sp. MMG016]
MKKLKYSLGIFIALNSLLFGCQEDDASVGEIIAPSNIQVSIDIVGADANNPNGDGSGTVNFSATADNAITYKFVFNGNEEVSPSGNKTYDFSVTGISTYTITVIAVGTGGISSSTSVDVEVLVLYEPPIELITLLTTGSWRIKSEASGHFGLGPVGANVPAEFFAAPPNDKAGVGMYDDRYIFSADGTFTHITNSENDDPTEDPSGTVFGRINLIDELGSHSITPNGADIENYPLDDYTGGWSVSAPGGLETLNLTGTGFIGYYTGGNHRYELFRFAQQPPNELILRTTDGNNEFDWWFIITSEEVDTGDDVQPPFDTLIWSDEFDINGAPSATNWTYDLGTGTNGWGNNESQTYTNDPSNVIVENGLLKITAIAENGGYTSARIKSQDLFEFTYGRVEVRAKLPAGGGTWPAIWMLGANIPDIGWPNCGEIDIMEHVGNNQDVVSSALHFPGNSGGNPIFKATDVPGASMDFHVYAVEWSSSDIVFFIDGVEYHRYSYTQNLPFYNKDFFLILNVAMGGSFGGTIDSGFTESSMEIDYVRVYQ